MALAKCRECGAEVSRNAKTCPKCGTPRPSNSKNDEILKSLSGLIVPGIILYFLYSTGFLGSFFSGLSGGSNSTSSTSQVVDTATFAPPAGSRQQQFVKIAKQAQAEYQAASTDLQKGASRPSRASRLCAEFNSARISDWTGKITTLTTNSDGKGVLSIDVGDGIKLGTWNNSFSDISSNTLIEPSSSIFQALMNMKVGDVVNFSGTMFKDETDCFREKSISLRGSVTSPEFAFRFTAITKH